IALPLQYEHIHNVFHVFMLRKYIPDPTHVIQYEDVAVQEDMTYEERPVEIVDQMRHTLRNKEVPLVKVRWLHHGVEECTWEPEADMRDKHPHVFVTL
ncbi:hypothetical protein QML37_31405, partial [Klebsiella pneumoniae]|uniref:hypothetical protein n=1 Tax=Klebsiella pneumoniae TaxID=573 RepID=UPI003A800AB2